MTGGNFDTSVIANEMYNQAFRLRRDRAGLGAGGLPVHPGLPIVIYQIRNLRKQRESR